MGNSLGKKGCTIECVLNDSTATATAADLALLHRLMISGPIIQDAVFRIKCMARETSPKSLQPRIALLLVMTRVTMCELAGLNPCEWVPLLNPYPDVQELTFWACGKMTDAELQELAGFMKQVTELKCVACNSLTPMGLYALCLCLPEMCSVVCCSCPKLDQAELDRCAALLKRHNMLVTMKATSLA